MRVAPKLLIMSPTTLFLNKVLAIFTVAGDVFIIVFIVAFLLKLLWDDKRLYDKIADFFYKRGLFLGFLIAASTVVGSLYYSDIAGFEPCKLCWLQRIFLYPQAIILALALWFKDRGVAVYSLWLSAIGIIIAIDQNLLQFLNVSLIPCSSAVTAACNKLYVYEFNYVTIPVMSFTAFALLIIIMWFAREKKGS